MAFRKEVYATPLFVASAIVAFVSYTVQWLNSARFTSTSDRYVANVTAQTLNSRRAIGTSHERPQAVPGTQPVYG